MRISVVIICSVLIAQTSASFFSELTNSVSIVRSSVGKLLGDAAVDLKDTFDCTVFAVRQAFSSYSTVPDYYQKCQGDKAEDTMPLTPSRPVQINIIPIVEPTSANIYRSSQPTNREQKNLKDKPDTTIDKKIEKKIQSVESYMLGETHILAIMSSKLEHEFEDLSKHVNYNFTKKENDQKQLSIETVMQGIDKLHEEEAIHRNNTEREIREIFDRVTKPDSKSNNTHTIVLKEEIKAALTELEQNKNKTLLQHEFENRKEEELKSLNDIKELLKEQEKNDTIKPDLTSTTTSNPSKNEKSLETVTITKPVTSTEPSWPSADIITSTKVTITTPLVLSTTKPAKTTKNNLIKTNNYLLKKDKKTLGQALKLFSKGRKTSSLMAKIFKRTKSAPSVFDHPELLIERTSQNKSNSVSMYNGFINNIRK